MQTLLVLFDGFCHLCSGSVVFIIDRDRRRRFRFAPLQTTVGQGILKKFDLPLDCLETFILVEGDRVYRKSTAALRIAKQLQWPWPMLYPLIAIPRPVRDALYDWIGRNRYRFFGKRTTCFAPTAELQDRFIE